MVKKKSDASFCYLPVMILCSSVKELQKKYLNEWMNESGLLVLRGGAISHNGPQITSDRTIHEKSHNS